MEYLPGILLDIVLAFAAYYGVIFSISYFSRRERRRQEVLPLLPKLVPAQTGQARGLAFEDFVVKRFDPGHFKLMKWRGDRSARGIYADSNELPDLEYQALFPEAVIPFAIECKWRPAFTEGKVLLSGPGQLAGYRRFQTEKEKRVFVVIGIGGSEACPKDCYVIPVDVIPEHFTYLSAEFIAPYLRPASDQVFYLDVSQMTIN